MTSSYTVRTRRLNTGEWEDDGKFASMNDALDYAREIQEAMEDMDPAHAQSDWIVLVELGR